MSQINLSLTINETNAVLVALSKFPFEQVAALIENLKNQAGPQVEAIQAAEQAVTETEGGATE